MTKPVKYKTAEQVIKEKADAEELRQLRNLKRNLESGIVFNLNITPELMHILLTYETKDL